MPADRVYNAARLSVPVDRPGGGRFGDRWFALRNRLLSNAAFQSWAVRVPLVRRIAGHRASALFDLCAGFVYSQALLACVQLRLFDWLAEGPQTLDRLAARMSLSVDATTTLLQAAAALNLVERRADGGFGLGVLGAALAGNPAVIAMIKHHGSLYADLRDPVALLRGEHPDPALGHLWPYANAARPTALTAQQVGEYSALMAASQPLVAADLLAAYRLERHHCLLDVGGGDGTFLTEAAAAAPALQLMLFDLPAVADRARARFAAAGLSQRTQVFGGDFRNDPLPVGADVISLVRVIHDHDDGAARDILRNAWQALPPGGTLLLAEPMRDTPRSERVGAYFSLYLLAMGSGRSRDAKELADLLGTAGFRKVRLVATRRPMQMRLIVALR